LRSSRYKDYQFGDPQKEEHTEEEKGGEKLCSWLNNTIIDRDNPQYSVIDEEAFKAKNLCNAGNYEVRQSYILEGKYLSTRGTTL